MIHRLLARVLNWNWLRREVCKGLARWAAPRLLEQEAWIRDLAVLNAELPPAEAVAEYARRHGKTRRLQQPLLVTLEEIADNVDGKGDYLAAGVRLFRELLLKGARHESAQ